MHREERRRRKKEKREEKRKKGQKRREKRIKVVYRSKNKVKYSYFVSLFIMTKKEFPKFQGGGGERFLWVAKIYTPGKRKEERSKKIINQCCGSKILRSFFDNFLSIQDTLLLEEFRATSQETLFMEFPQIGSGAGTLASVLRRLWTFL